jgi:hypothetical protein
MEQAAAIIGISGIIILMVNIANQKKSHFGSDHFFHLNLIRLIKSNHHRFVERYQNFIGNEYLSYPQLFHWIMGFFNMNHPSGLILIYKSVIFFLDVSFFLIFFYSGFLRFTSRLPLFIIFLYAALLFIFTPFNFVRWNSTNAGFSPRSLGVLLGRIFLYLFLFQHYHSAWVFYAGLIAVVYIIFLSSQFAMQFVLFFCIIYGILFMDWRIFSVPFLAFALFYLLHKKIAINYIKGQYRHKKIYAVHFAKRFILKYRPGIWRDFIYDFWIKLKKEKWAALPYIQTNAVVTFFWGFTIMPLVIYFIIRNNFIAHQKVFWPFITANPLIQIALITMLIFFLTSLAKTRFLGEPERYLEFATPSMVFIFIESYGSRSIYIAIIYYVIMSLLLIFISKWYDKKSARVKDNLLWQLDTVQPDGKSLISVLEGLKRQYGRLNLFSNNEEITRYLLVLEDVNFLLPDIAAEKTGSFFYKDIYHEQYPCVNESLLLPMINEFEINVMVIDTGCLLHPCIEKLESLSFKRVFEMSDFVLLHKS